MGVIDTGGRSTKMPHHKQGRITCMFKVPWQSVCKYTWIVFHRLQRTLSRWVELMNQETAEFVCLWGLTRLTWLHLPAGKDRPEAGLRNPCQMSYKLPLVTRSR